MNITKINTKNILKFENVEIDEITVTDEEKAVQMAGASEGYDFALAMLSISCTFDGKKYPMEDLKRLSRNDFLQLMQSLNASTPNNSEETSLNLQDMQDSNSQPSGE